MFVCVRDHAVVFCSRIEHSNACCNVYKEYDDDDICISFICIIYAIYYTKNKVFLSSIFEISHIYYMYVYVPLVKIFRVAWPCEDFRENAACAAFALQESFLNDLPCSTFCASRPPRISLIFRFRIRIHLELNEREGEREGKLSREYENSSKYRFALSAFVSLSLSSSSFSIIITYYYRAVLLLMFGLLNSHTAPSVSLFLCFAFIFKIFVFFFYVYLFFTVREKSEKYCS